VIAAYALDTGIQLAAIVDAGDVRGIAVDGNELIFANSADGTILRASTIETEPVVIVKDQDGIRDICRQGPVLYWVRVDGQIWRMAL
jgi:hypothetical protein